MIFQVCLQKSLLRQYALSLTGGSPGVSYKLGLGYDQNRDNLIRNGYNRVTVNSYATFYPVNKMEFYTSFNYSHSNTIQPNQLPFGGVSVNGSNIQGFVYIRIRIWLIARLHSCNQPDYRYGNRQALYILNHSPKLHQMATVGLDRIAMTVIE